MDYELDPNQKSPDVDLLSFEKLDRSSPDLWPQIVPGLNEFAALIKTPNKIQNQVVNSNSSTSINNLNQTTNPKWMSDLNKADIEMLNELATINTSQLIDKVKDLIEIAYQLGLEESNQMTRGRLLNILDDNKNSI